MSFVVTYISHVHIMPKDVIIAETMNYSLLNWGCLSFDYRGQSKADIGCKNLKACRLVFDFFIVTVWEEMLSL